MNPKEEIIKEYYDVLKSKHVSIVKETVPVGKHNRVVELRCFLLKDSSKVSKITCSKGTKGDPKDRKYQYDLRSFDGTRPRVTRIPFLLSDNYYNKDYTVSHLCHNDWCLNPRHHSFETLEVNKGRNGCCGGGACIHNPKCIRRGRYASGIGESPHSFGNKVFII